MNACCPLNYLMKMVRARGLEPPHLTATDPKSAASAIPPRPRGNKNGDPRWTRTNDTLIKSQVLYRLS